MKAAVNPWVAVLVIVVVAAIFGARFHADGERARTPGPSFLRVAPDGDLWLVLGPSLYRFAPDGTHRETLALADFHAADLTGDIGFFSNGDLLLRAAPAAGDQAFSAGDLLRCTPATRDCRRWGQDRFDTVFRLHIDAADTVFIADTMRHRVLRRSADGHDQGALQEGLGYPNQPWREGDRLYVTLSDGGRRAVQWFALGKQTLGDRLGSADIGHTAGVAAGHVMASDILRVGGHWWVNLMRAGQRDGGLYRFDAQWQLLGRVDLPAAADPLLMVAWQGDVLVSDFRLRRILRFAADGSARPDFAPPVLQSAFAALREREQQYRRLSQALLAAFGLLLVAGFGVAFWQQRPR